MLQTRDLAPMALLAGHRHTLENRLSGAVSGSVFAPFSGSREAICSLGGGPGSKFVPSTPLQGTILLPRPRSYGKRHPARVSSSGTSRGLFPRTVSALSRMYSRNPSPPNWIVAAIHP